MEIDTDQHLAFENTMIIQLFIHNKSSGVIFHASATSPFTYFLHLENNL